MSITTKQPRLLTSLLAIDETTMVDLLKRNKSYIKPLALLVTNLFLETIKALDKHEYKRFDANPGDGGCQIRAQELKRLVIKLEEEGYSQEDCFLKKKVLEFKKAAQNKKIAQAKA